MAFRSLLFIITLSLLSQPTIAADQSTPLGNSHAVRVMRYDSKLDGQLKPKSGVVKWRMSIRNNRVTGELATLPVGSSKQHQLSGEVASGKSPIVTLRQDGPNNLTCYYTGRLVSEGKIVGTWYDNRGGEGDFELSVGQADLKKDE